jgi:hypothetical protein
MGWVQTWTKLVVSSERTVAPDAYVLECNGHRAMLSTTIPCACMLMTAHSHATAPSAQHHGPLLRAGVLHSLVRR